MLVDYVVHRGYSDITAGFYSCKFILKHKGDFQNVKVDSLVFHHLVFH